MSLPRRHPLIFAVVLVAVLAGAFAAFAAWHAAEEERERNAACPPGSTNEAQRERQERREQRMMRSRGYRVDEKAEKEREGEGEGGRCALRKHPEPIGELAAVNASRTVRQTAPASRVKPDAYASAARARARAQAEPRVLPGAGGTWRTAGQGPLINDLPDYAEVNTLGLADINGRTANFAHDAASDRLYAAVGEGGVWRSDDMGKNWRSISDTLATQAVAAVAVAPARGERPATVIALTGDDIYGGGSSTPGVGVWRTTNDGQSWEHADGVPSGTLGFALVVDPTNADIVYAATGVGLYRSTDAGRTFGNVNLPTGDCAGKTFGGGCFLANVVTDVVVQAPGGVGDADGGAVIAAVGWRAGNKVGPDGKVESPNNGIYTSETGAPGSFAKVDPDASGFGSGPLAADQSSFQDVLGRAELGIASGPEQDHDYLYAIVQDASAFKKGEVSGIDVPESSPAAAPSNTYLRGVYVSSDLGQTWTRMTGPQELQLPTTGSALTGSYCGTLYCPGIQAWYNAWIKPDPTQADGAGVPTRLTFGLEEVWQNEDTPTRQPQDGPSTFKVIGRYYGGETCQGRHLPISSCPTNRFDANSTTTHPDQHGGLYVPRPGGGVTLVVGNDGGTYTQTVAQDEEFSNAKWGRGANQGFYTLLPYDAQIAKDDVIYAGLQDNGEVKITPDGKQAGVFGGDGGFSAVDPDNSQVAYEEYTNAAIAVTTDGGKTWADMAPPEDTYMFINAFTMDPNDANHLLTGGTKVYETTAGPGTADSGWTQVFDLGSETSGAPRQTSATDVRSVPTGGGAGLPTGPKTADVTVKGGGAGTAPGPTTDPGNAADPALTFFAPGTYEDTPFTIRPGEGDASATVTLSSPAPEDDDWDLYVYRKDGDDLVEVGRSATGGTPPERLVVPNPQAGDYIVRAHNYTAGGTYDLSVVFAQRTADTPKSTSAAYVGFCGYCEPLINRPFANGIATNVGGPQPGKPLTGDGWHIARAAGLPRRYITSVQIDPSDARTVYVTLGGYSRRWIPVGALGEETRDVGTGHVFKSTDAGETFTDVSGDLPDAPANFSTIRRGQLVVSTDVGVFISRGASGGHYDLLGSGLPTVPVYSAEIKPKATETEADTLVVGTYGRGVWRYEFRDSATVEPVSSINLRGPVACAASNGFRSVKVTPRRGGGAKIAFARRVRRPVSVDVFQTSRGRTVIGERLVARFSGRNRSFTWNGRANRRGRKATDGYFFVRYRMKNGKTTDVRRVVLRRTRGRLSVRPSFYRRASCGTLASYKLERPVFGGPRNRSLIVSFRLARAAKVKVTVLRGKKVIRTFAARNYRAGRTNRLRFDANRRPRGDYRFRLDLTQGSEKLTSTLTSRRI